MASYTLLTLDRLTGTIETTTVADAMTDNTPSPDGSVTGWELECGTVACRDSGFTFETRDVWSAHHLDG